MPGYLSVITGVDITAEPDPDNPSRTWPIARDTLLFIFGFSAVFVGLGLSASTVGEVLFDNQLLLTRVSGVLVAAMGIYLLYSLVATSPQLFQEVRFHPNLGRFGRAAPPIAGAAFGFGWTPCIGPVLGSIIAIAATSGRAWTGGTLLASYSLGLGIPFLVTGLAFSRVAGGFDWLKRHSTVLVLVSGFGLLVFGALLIVNRLIWVTTQLQDALRAVGLDWIVNLG